MVVVGSMAGKRKKKPCIGEFVAFEGLRMYHVQGDSSTPPPGKGPVLLTRFKYFASAYTSLKISSFRRS